MIVLTPSPNESKKPDFVNDDGNGPSTKKATLSKVKNMVGESQKMVAAGLLSPIVRFGGSEGRLALGAVDGPCAPVRSFWVSAHRRPPHADAVRTRMTPTPTGVLR